MLIDQFNRAVLQSYRLHIQYNKKTEGKKFMYLVSFSAARI